MRKWGRRQGFLVFRRRGSRQASIFVPRIVGQNFDSSLGKTWFQYCERYHNSSCSGTKRTTKGLRLIDCHSSVVVPASSQEKYVALSYVWGLPSVEDSAPEKNSPDCLHDTPPLADLPATISDAMKVTIDMGFDYLWVDKFCIDQKDEAVKHGQISQMDSIYQNAELTIIAAAGSDPTYGLPGMSSRLREPYPTVAVRGINIISTLEHPHSSIQSSKWSERGWTLQEAVLSRRRLVFTDDQVYFECTAMNCHESLASPLDKLHVRDRSKFRNIMLGGIFGRNRYQEYCHFNEKTSSPMRNFDRFSDIVQQYSNRNLTYDSDALKAMYGIFREFEDNKTQIAQIYGIPFFSSMPDKTMVSFLNGLTWHHQWPWAKWDHRMSQPQRRENFPSWSWAGWVGNIVTGKSISGQKFLYDRIEVSSVSIDIGTETIFDLSKYSQDIRVGDDLQLRTPYLQFRAPLFPSSLISYDDSSEPPRLKMGQSDVGLFLSVGPADPYNFMKSLEDRGQQCIYWGQFLEKSNHLMVLQPESDGTWSRVGMIYVHAGPYKHYFQRQWSGVRMGTPEYNRWLKERPTGYFRVS
ncbi:tol protein [Colletotrichum chrysophilum]|uniref:Tol protein n=1 Tax=Colletotrichum chrysophilum TaxID=1836956 RepID=A0AAD9AX30_9PEZI|nr:tol protein [Colletotrichum chrysophilum]